MKKLILVTAVLFCVNFQSLASHFVGGNIGWKCQGNGMFVFEMEIYRDCSGIPFTFRDGFMNVSSGIFNSNNQMIDTILMKADSSKYFLNQYRFINTRCNPNGFNAKCGYSDDITIERFFYKSDPIQLKGTPPSNGIRFVYVAGCCRSNGYDNINQGGRFVLHATMYRIPNPNWGQSGEPQFLPVDSCMDSSPDFYDLNNTARCSDQNSYYLFNASDPDFDSISYSFNRAFKGILNTTQLQFQLVPYKNGFTYFNPTPSTIHNSANIPSTLDTNSGFVYFKNHSHFNNKFNVKGKATAYRNGHKIAEVNHELPIFTRLCSPLINNNLNTNPVLMLDGIVRQEKTVYVAPNSTVNVAISAIDNNPSSFGGTQELILTTQGQFFASDFVNSNNCVLAPCATLSNMTFDTSFVEYTNRNIGAINSTFNWTPSTAHLSANGSAKAHYFYLKVQDDHCLIPASTNAVIKVVVDPTLTSVKENTFSNAVSLYPNPTTGVVNLGFATKQKNLTIAVRDLSGKLVQSQNENNTSNINLTLKGKPGIYFVEITNERGEKAFKKVVKN